MVFLGEKIIAVKKKQSRNLEVLVETLCIFVSKLKGGIKQLFERSYKVLFCFFLSKCKCL